MEYLAGCKENQFDLAICDPPYGIGENGQKPNRTDRWKGAPKEIKYKKATWDKKPVGKNCIDLILHSSKNQIIWGANHFISKISIDSSCWIVWDKKTAGDFADCELAWTSFDTTVRKFEWLWNGFRKEKPEHRIHPTQKPIALYRWLLQNYAKQGDTILDTHGGSMSIAIACYIEGFDLVCIEKDKDYYDAAKKRYDTYVANNPRMFEPEELRQETQGELF
jgi:site-specific DNA-methyltransferase (adenine-specific)